MNGKDEEILPSEPWEIFLWIRQNLSARTIMQVLNVSQVQAYRYCRNPKTNSEACHTPLELLRNLFDEMKEQGGKDVVIIALNYLAQSIDASVRRNGSTVPDKNCLQDELLDNHPKFAELEQAMLRGDAESHVQVLLQEAKAELDQDFVAYKREWGLYLS